MTLKPRCSQLIREQMVKSLEIIKDLEEQVKLVPMLKVTSIINSIIIINTLLLRVNTKISRREHSERVNKLNKSMTILLRVVGNKGLQLHI